MTTRKPTRDQRMWTAIRVMRSNIDAQQLMLTAGVSQTTATLFLRLLTRAGYLQKRVTRDGGLWRMVRDTGSRAPVRHIDVFIDANTGEAFCLKSGAAPALHKLWSAARARMTDFTNVDLAHSAGTSTAAAMTYLGVLERAGVVVKSHRSGRNRYAIVRDLGPLPPFRAFSPDRIDSLRDPNSGQYLPLMPSRKHVASSARTQSLHHAERIAA